MFDKILEILSTLGLPGVFIGVFLEAIGLPFPGSVMVVLAGFLAKQGEFSIIIAWIVSLLGYLVGSISAFTIGRHIGEAFVQKWGKYVRLTPERINRAQELLRKSAPAYVIVGRFLPTIGNITPYVAGISGIFIVKFLIYDMVHAVIWLTVFLSIGAMLNLEWQKIADSPWFMWGAVGSGLLILIYVFKDLLFMHNKKEV